MGGVTLGGRRTLRIGTYASAGELPQQKGQKEDVWDTWAWSMNGVLAAGLKDVRMTGGCAYLSAPYCFEHGVRYEKGSVEEPVIALQFRCAFDAVLGARLNDKRD